MMLRRSTNANSGENSSKTGTVQACGHKAYESSGKVGTPSLLIALLSILLLHERCQLTHIPEWYHKAVIDDVGDAAIPRYLLQSF